MKCCSRKCAARWRVLHGFGFIFEKGHVHSELTKRKIGDSHRAEKSVNWKGGRTGDGHGYMKVLVGGKYVLEHRHVMEKYLNRRLGFLEHVHHVNGVKDDNRIENLQVLSKSEHHSLHNRGRRRR